MDTPDRSPLDELVSHAGFLRALARGMLGDEHLAEDVVQQTFLKALARPPAHDGFLRAWLARVVRNLASNVMRSEERRARRERATARDEAEPAHERATLELALQREVAAAVAELHEPYRTVVHLRYFRGRAPAQIAQELAVPLKTVESRLTRAHALLRGRLERAWLAQDERSRARYLALTLSGPGWPLLGGMLMTKQGILVGLGAAALLGLFLTWRALEPGARGQAGETARSALAAPPAPAPASAEGRVAQREAIPAPREAPAPDAGASSPAMPELELGPALERLSVVLDRSLDGRLDPGAILDAALLVAAHEARDPLAELDVGGRLLLPLDGLPANVSAELCVSKPNMRQETLLTLQIELAREGTFVFEGHERSGPSVQLTTRTNTAGELMHFSMLTDVQPEGRAPGVVVDPPRFTYGVSLYTPIANPSEWKLQGTGLTEEAGSLKPDGGRSYRSGGWDVPQVLEGGPWPRVEDMQRLSRRLLEMHAAVKNRAKR